MKLGEKYEVKHRVYQVRIEQSKIGGDKSYYIEADISEHDIYHRGANWQRVAGWGTLEDAIMTANKILECGYITEDKIFLGPVKVEN